MLQKSLVFMFVIVGLLMMGCSSEKETAQGETFGAGVSLASAVPINEVFTQVSELNGKIVRVTGTINDLCKHKGCWMQVKDGEQVLTVRFKDEAFILPASAIGRNVDFEGLFIAEKLANPLSSQSGCAEGGNHEGDGACESERAERSAKKASNMRYTMVSTGLVLI